MAISKKIREEVYRKYDGHCAYCGREIAYKDIGIVQTATKLLLSAKVAENELIASRTAPTAGQRWTEVQNNAESVQGLHLLPQRE